MKRSRRPLALFALLFLSGAIVNLATAWWIAARVEPSATMHFSPRQPREVIRDSAPSAWLVGSPPQLEWLPAPQGAVYTRASGWHKGLQWAFDGVTYCRLEDVAVGWPLPTLRSRRFEVRVRGEAGFEVTSGPTWLSGPRVATRFAPFSQTDGRLPLVPVLPGLLVNTILYTTAIAVALALPLSFFPVRRCLRARRGRCPKCGYDLAGLADPAAPCPECGAA